MKPVNIANENEINELILHINEKLINEEIFEFFIVKNYLRLPSLEEKLFANNFLISALAEYHDYIKIIVRKLFDLTSISDSLSSLISDTDKDSKKTLSAGPNLNLCPNLNQNIVIDLDIKAQSLAFGNLKDFRLLTKILSLFPDSSLKKLTINDINFQLTYKNLEELFFESFRVISCGSSFYINYKEEIFSERLLKGYLEYAGFIDVYPASAPGEYEYGKIKISAKKESLSDLSKKPKKVLLNIESEKPENLIKYSVFIRDLHNKYNNWDLYLVSDEWKFYDENIYLKYCSDKLPPNEKFDYGVYLDDSENNFASDVDYPLKPLNSRKADVFFSRENFENVSMFLKSHGIRPDDLFCILDTAFICSNDSNGSVSNKSNVHDEDSIAGNNNYNSGSGKSCAISWTDRDISGNYAKDALEFFNRMLSVYFPYIYKIGFKILFLEDDFNILSLKDKALLMQLASYYAGGGFNYFLADSLSVSSNNISLDKINYKIPHNNAKDDSVGDAGDNNNYDVSIIIPVYNNFKYTKQCVFSIFRNHPLVNFEIIIVDNGSTDETREFFKSFQELENFKIISNKENLGFAKASNLGASLSKAPYILFLNNDTVVSKGAIDELYCSLTAEDAKSSGVAASGPLLLYPDRKIQSAGIMFERRLIPNVLSGVDVTGCKNSDAKNIIYLRNFNALTAACLLVKKDIFYDVGGFDENYINGYEDVDLCLKLREAGNKLIFNPKSIVFHFEKKTYGRNKYDIDNINRFHRKWKHKYKADDYIFAKMDNLLYMEQSESNDSTLPNKIIPLTVIKLTENKIDDLIAEKNYNEAIKLSDHLLTIDKYNIKNRKKNEEIKLEIIKTKNKKSESEKHINLLLEEKERMLFSYRTIINNIIKSNKDVKISLDQNEIYKIWIKYNEPSEIELERQTTFKFKYSPKISVIMPVYNTPEEYLRKAIESVINQTYQNWELCIADDASAKPYIKEILKYYQEQDKNGRIKIAYRTENGHISKASNSALSIATGDYIALLDHDDELAEFALFEVVKEINEHPDAKLLYSDEDKLYIDGSRFMPYFKSDWNPDLFLSQNFISHLGIYKKSVIDEINGFREGYEGSQDYDLALRFIEKIKYNEIRHIPRILYHWRMVEGSTAITTSSKSYAIIAARKAVQDHLDRLNIKAKVVEAPMILDYNRVIYDIAGNPLISLIIITHNGFQLVKDLIESIFEKTSYKNFEIILINRDSDELQTLEYLKLLKEHEKIKVFAYNKPFNYSKVVNLAVKYAGGEVLVVLNDDMKIINDDWLRELASNALRSEAGVVGAKLLYLDDTIQHAGVIIGSDREKNSIAVHSHQLINKDASGYFGRAQLLQNYSAVTGACMALRTDIYEKAGGMDENLAVAYNDVDFCLKVMQLGYYNVYTPYAMLYHYESRTRGYEDTEEKQVRFKKEKNYLKAKWGKLLEHDFAYNINLSFPDNLFSIKLPGELQGILN